MGEVSRRDDAPAPVPVDPATLPTLEVDELVKESEDQLAARGVAYGREYIRIEHHPTMLLKNLAAVAVALRVKYGDMRGQSYEYRQRMREIYAAAGMGSEVQGSVRYHIGNLLRRSMTPRELEKHELLPTSPLERLQDGREIRAKLTQAAKTLESMDKSLIEGLIPSPVAKPKPAKKSAKQAQASGKGDAPKSTGPELKATADALRLATVANGIIGQLDADVIDDHMTDGQRAKLDDELAAIQKRLTALRRHTRKPSSKV
ncbi:hypothetical protein [Streptomyces sp. R44]|uniref:Uncharacterized protein n=1 Tax=Streptomyces sp. R44 TaxID=3238633 RepID=A0AB39T4K7_9ACTN